MSSVVDVLLLPNRCECFFMARGFQAPENSVRGCKVLPGSGRLPNCVSQSLELPRFTNRAMGRRLDQ